MELTEIKHGEAIIDLLLEPKTYVSFIKFHEVLHISRRTFFYTLKKLNAYLDEHDLDMVQNMKGVGYYLPDDTKQVLVKQTKKNTPKLAVFPQKERHILIMLSLINNERVSLELTQKRFHITHHTAVSDLKMTKQLAHKYHLTVESESTGTTITGTERNQRNWFLSALSEHGALINSVLEIDPHQALAITELLHTLETLTGNYFSDDALSILITFFSWYLKRLADPSKQLQPSNSDVLDPSAIIEKWAGTVLSKYHIQNIAEQLFITYLVKSGQFIHINTNDTLAHSMTPIVKQIIKRFNDVSGSQIAVDSLELPLLTHLLSTYYRVKYRVTFTQPSLKTIQEQYSELIFFTRLALKPFEDFVQQKLPEEEITLVAIYFGGVLRNESTNDATVNVVCSSGIGTSKILYEELHRRYPNIKFSNPMSVFKLKNSQLTNIKLIISTIQLKSSFRIPTIVVAPIPTESQWQQIDQELAHLKIIKRATQAITVNNLMDIISDYTRIVDPAGLQNALTNLLAHDHNTSTTPTNTNIGLKSLLPKENILIHNSAFSNWKAAIRYAFSPLIANSSITNKYVDKIISSTQKYGPYMVIGNGVMLAHARPADGVKKIGMSLLVLGDPLTMHDANTHEDKPVKVIIGLAPIDAAEHVLALSQLVKMLQQPHWLADIENATNSTMIYEKCFNITIK